MKGGKKRRRNTIAVKMDLIDAVGSVLKKHGFSKLGINIVAEEAGVDKNVIYRNFETFDKLLEAYVEKKDFWLRTLEENRDKKIEDPRAFLKYLLFEHFNTLYSNEEFQQLLIWELGGKDDFTTSLAIKREVLSNKINIQGETLLRDFDINFNFISATLIAGIYYLILHKDKSTFCNTDIAEKKDREDYIKAIDWLVDLIFDKIESASYAERIVIKAHSGGMGTEAIAELAELSIDKVQKIINQA